MNGDLISRSALLANGIKVRCGLNDNGMIFVPMADVRKSIEKAPAVDAVEVVRCKDCKYFHQKVSCGGFCKCGEVNGGQPHMRVNEDFCSYGERGADHD